MISQYCRNCGRYDPKIDCPHDNIERILKQEKAQACAFWTPATKIDAEFRAEVMRKVEENR